MIGLLIALQSLANPVCNHEIQIDSQRAQFDYGMYEIVWQHDVNRDGKVDVFTNTDRCGEKDCQPGLYLNCGDGRFTELIAPDHGQSTIRPTRAQFNGWVVLGQRKTKNHLDEIELNHSSIDLQDDLNDALSQERLFNQNQVLAHYEASGHGAPSDLNGQFVQVNGKYHQVYRDGEIKYLMELVELGDHQAASILFYDVLKSKIDYEPYARAKRGLVKKDFIRSLFKTGFSALPRDVDYRYLEDSLTERYFIRANVANLDPEYLANRVREDQALKEEILKYSADNLAYLPKSIQSEQRATEIALAENRRAMEFVSPDFLNDTSLTQNWCESYKISVRFSSKSVLSDLETAKKCIDARPINYQFFSKKIRSNKALARKTFGRDGYMIAFAPPAIKNDLELAKLALQSYPQAKRFLPKAVLNKLRVR